MSVYLVSAHLITLTYHRSSCHMDHRNLSWGQPALEAITRFGELADR